MDDKIPAMSAVQRDSEEESDEYFNRIFGVHPTLSVDEFLEDLKRFKKSSQKSEREIFCCVLRTLFEQRRFLYAYPENSLIIIANLFGGIIEHALLSDYKDLGLALRIILDSLKKSPESQIYNFGIIALDRFKHRLKDFKQYCADISKIPHFQRFPKHLIEYLEKGKHSQGPTVSRSVPRLDEERNDNLPKYSLTPNTRNVPGKENIVTTATTTTNVNLPTSNEYAEQNLIEPPRNVKKNVEFFFDNLCEIDLQNECEEIKRVITIECCTPWLAWYIVMNRVGTERKLHTLYMDFLKYYDSEYLNSLIVSETYKNIRVLLKNNKGTTNDTYQNPHRFLISNYGQWLGLMTLGKNRPISDQLDLKMLLIEAFNKGQQELLFTVPFIASIMKSCNMSEKFGLNNPWTLSILNCLAELYNEPGLELWLKFEIEILCETLCIELKELKPTRVLKDPETLKNLKRHLLS